MTTHTFSKRGDTYRRRFTLENTDQAGDPWTFAMFTRIIWTLRRTLLESSTDDLTDTNVITTVSSATNAIEVDPADETAFILRIDPAITTTWPPGTWYWDCQGVIEGAVTEVHTLDSGKLLIEKDVSRRTSP